MTPPDALTRQGVTDLACMGDGRQSGTSGSPSILNVSPESAVGGGLALLETGDKLRVDLNTRKVDVLLPADELARRRAAWTPPDLPNQTPWEEIYRANVGQLELTQSPSGTRGMAAPRVGVVADRRSFILLVPRRAHALRGRARMDRARRYRHAGLGRRACRERPATAPEPPDRTTAVPGRGWSTDSSGA